MITPLSMTSEEVDQASFDELVAAYQADGRSREQAEAYARALRGVNGADLFVD